MLSRPVLPRPYVRLPQAAAQQRAAEEVEVLAALDAGATTMDVYGL